MREFSWPDVSADLRALAREMGWHGCLGPGPGYMDSAGQLALTHMKGYWELTALGRSSVQDWVCSNNHSVHMDVNGHLDVYEDARTWYEAEDWVSDEERALACTMDHVISVEVYERTPIASFTRHGHDAAVVWLAVAMECAN